MKSGLTDSGQRLLLASAFMRKEPPPYFYAVLCEEHPRPHHETRCLRELTEIQPGHGYMLGGKRVVFDQQDFVCRGGTLAISFNISWTAFDGLLPARSGGIKWLVLTDTRMDRRYPRGKARRGGAGVHDLSFREERQSQALDFVLHTNRNLLLGLVVTFGMCIFAINADTVLKRSDPGTRVSGTLSAVCAGLGMALMVISVTTHSYMVYKNDEMIVPGITRYWWYFIPLSALFTGVVPLVIYLSLLF